MTVPSTWEITYGDDQSLYEGRGVRDPEELWLEVSLDGRGFHVDMSDDLGYYHRYQRTSVNLTNTQQANTGGDAAQVPPEVFRRVTESWEQGSGQDRYDRDNSLPWRYRDSHRVDVWKPWKASLLPDVTQILPLDAGRVFLETVGGQYLVAGAGTNLYWWTDLTGPPVTVFSGNPIVAMCSDGQALYVQDNAGFVEKWTSSGTHSFFTLVTGFDSSRPLLAYVQGYLISAAGEVLLDISTGTQAEIYTHPNSSYSWRAAAAGLNATYLIGGMGDKWQLSAMTLKQDATTFNPPSVAAPLMDGEIGYAVATYLGQILIGTSLGWRFGDTDTSGKVTYGELVNEGVPVRCFEGQNRFVWYGMNATTDRTAGLGRADLSTFVTTLTPASAPDLATPVTAGDVTAVVTFAGKRVFAVQGDGVWTQTDTLAPDGWLEQGSISYNTSDIKQGLYADVHHDPLQGSLTVEASFDGAGFGLVGTNTNGGSSAMGHLSMASPFTRAELRYTLTRDPDDTTLGPVLSRVEVRAIPVSGKATEWRLPIHIASQVEFDGSGQLRDVDADYDLLLDLFTTKRPVRFREASRFYTVYCTDFLFLGKKFTNQNRSLEGVYIVIIREVQ